MRDISFSFVFFFLPFLLFFFFFRKRIRRRNVKNLEIGTNFNLGNILALYKFSKTWISNNFKIKWFLQNDLCFYRHCQIFKIFWIPNVELWKRIEDRCYSYWIRNDKILPVHLTFSFRPGLFHSRELGSFITSIRVILNPRRLDGKKWLIIPSFSLL